ncbi:LAME_0F08086g1_1 [Lachancea meyersii CBS 8951]|uniref:LAME_0F08086g1_1 n=1 Tax=Lachancea meyersii CBS 8951 TaxID=1266667 RepID=A0A1G4JUG8_9SACH|nr:LAME_0F08086g1_1 [Lachancea meyersii CBS 8951]
MNVDNKDPPTALRDVKHILLILSGKGGVGKSSVTTQVALALAGSGYKVGVLDIDLTGPSIPRMFGLERQSVYQSREGWIPVSKYEEGSGALKVMSLGFLLNDRGSSVVWRGPKKTAMIKQFIKDVVWGELDYLLIDTPPGTSDEHISIAEELRWANPDGSIIVTTPQNVATADVKKEINFCRKVNLDILGIVENMSGFVCPFCAECTNIFSKGGGQKLSEELGIDFLGNVPIDPTFVELIEKQKTEGSNLVDLYQSQALFPVFQNIIASIQSKNIPSRVRK